ncbi:MAG: GAF domain-containing protein [Balneolaceae bacterium]
MNLNVVLAEVDSIVKGAGEREKKLQAICELLDREVSPFDWTGFYLVSEKKERVLELGPYVGEETDHTEIPFGQGICGQAAQTLETFVVQDVRKEGNYLACSPDVRSEIVVPVMKGERMVAELDIDSHTEGAITPELRELCEAVAVKVSRLF